MAAPEVETMEAHAVVIGTRERRTPVDVQHLTPSQEGGGCMSMPAVATTVTLLITSVFCPPVLFLNIPLVIAGAWLMDLWATRSRSVVVGPFDCPDCGSRQDALRWPGDLPVRHRCGACNGRLRIESATRSTRGAVPSR